MLHDGPMSYGAHYISTTASELPGSSIKSIRFDSIQVFQSVSTCTVSTFKTIPTIVSLFYKWDPKDAPTDHRTFECIPCMALKNKDDFFSDLHPYNSYDSREEENSVYFIGEEEERNP
jgi:hypothetical protein